jgi:uncharacterized protein YhjY with autotransporter beta-barrel domain
MFKHLGSGKMTKGLFSSVGISFGLMAFAMGTAAAQTYDTPGSPVISSEVTKQVTAVVASTLGAGVGGAVTGGVGGGVGGVETSAAPVTQFFAGGNRGRSAGAKDKKIGVWVLGSYSDIESDKLDADFDGDIINIVGGVDYRFTDRITAGLAISYQNTDLDTGFNVGTFENDGVGVSPYVVFNITKNISADINASWTTLSNDTTRTSGGAIVTGSFDSDRVTAGGNVSYAYAIKKWFLKGTVGFLYINEDQDSFTESNGTFVGSNDISIGQGRIGGTVGYNAGKWTPWVSLRAENEFWAPSDTVSGNGNVISADDFGLVVGAGVNFSLSDAVSGGLAFQSTQAREDLDLYTITGRVRVQF